MRSGTCRISKKCSTIRRSWRLAYLDAFQITRDPLFEGVARDILDYVRRDMTAPEGGFFSAEDADSEIPVVAPGQRLRSRKKRKAPSMFGRSRKSMRRSARTPRFSTTITASKPRATLRPAADPHGEFTGKNILIELTNDRGNSEAFQKRRTAKCVKSWRKSRATFSRSARNVRARIWTIKSSRPGTA